MPELVVVEGTVVDPVCDCGCINVGRSWSPGGDLRDALRSFEGKRVRVTVELLGLISEEQR